METLQQRLMRKVPGLRTPQPVGGIRMPASGFTAPSVPAPRVPQAIPGVGATKTVLNAPGKGKGLTMNPLSPGNLLREGAATLGITGASALAESAGTPGQARMSGLGLMGPAPVYQTPLNNVTAEQVAADKAKRAGMTDLEKIIGKPPTKEEPLPSTYNVMGVDYDSASGQAINPATKKISPGGYSITPGSGARTDYGDGDSRLGSLGTDTGSGDRESLRAAGGDPAYAAWAAANPTLAANLVKKVDERRMNNPEYTQVGYDQAKKQVDPSYDPSVRSQNFGPVANGEVYGRNLDLQGTTGVGPMKDGALYADMISGKEKPNADKASDLLNNYKAQLSANLEPFAETVIPSQSQNPVTFGGDNTPIDSELELSKVIPDFTGKMDGLNKNMSNRFRAF